MKDHAGNGPQARLLPDNRRLHLHHGPIDLVIEAYGQPGEIAAAYGQAIAAFEFVLEELADELVLLRQPWRAQCAAPNGAVARRMWRAAGLHGSEFFVTPMIAVAGAVADHVLSALTAGRELSRAYVNNGGDIGLFFGTEEAFDIGVCADPQTGEHASTMQLRKEHGIGGLATSGWRGRSHSMGIADAVTVLAKDAASADAAATLIANAVDLPASPRIKRAPANELSPDSDLGERLVTVAVGQLEHFDIELAMAYGCKVAQKMVGRGSVEAVFISLQGLSRAIGKGGPATCFEGPGPLTGEIRLEAVHA